jgi:hypothetical protein
VITFGHGGGDSVVTPFNLNQDTITFGNHTVEGDFVEAGAANQDVIVFGSGGGDHVFTGLSGGTGNLSNSSITFHDIASDATEDGVSSTGTISNSNITFGNTEFDRVSADVGGSNNTFTFGNGDNDSAEVSGLIKGMGASNNTFTFGNGIADNVEVFGPSSNNKITLGNGQSDFVTLGPTSTSPGGDYIATGTGAGDQVTVGAHTDADTFAFALGTTGVNFTTVSGAAAGDHVVVNGGQLGNTLLSSGVTAAPNLADYISSLGTLTKGDTYVAVSPLTGAGPATFIVTDTASGQIGAIELTGVQFQHSTLANHVLTLHT